MSQTPPNEPRRRDQLRRVLSRFTTNLRRANVHGDVARLDLASPTSPVVATQDEAGFPETSLPDTSTMIAVDEQNLTEPDQSRPSIALSTRTQSVHRSRRNSAMSTGTCTTIDRAAAHNERAQRMLRRYGIEVSPYDRQSSSHLPSTVSRVQKAPRMRSHRSCHECGADVGGLSQCIACEHRICQQCPRVSSRKVRNVVQEAREVTAPAERDSDRMSIDPPTPATRNPETQSLSSVHTTMVLEVDENEHEQAHEEYALPSTEQTETPSTNTERSTSEIPMSLEADDDASLMPPPPPPYRATHNAADTQLDPLDDNSSRPFVFQIPSAIRRSDLQLEAHPTAQRVYRKARQRIRFTCHQCETFNEQHARICFNCGHQRCEMCRRKPAIRRPNPPDPRVVEAVEQRLAAIR